ncbi:MAG: hypothetical protein U0441_11135 [Polyangiaceae bacterium]
MVLLLGCSGADGKDGADGQNGKDGKDGASCTVADNGDGTKTVTCPGSDPVTIANGADGADGTSCSVTDNMDGTKTITCTDNTTVTVSDAAPCTTSDDGKGNITIDCPGSDPVTVKDGTSCSVVDAGGGTAILSCTDGTKVVISQPIDTHLDPYEDLPGVVPTILSIGGGSNGDGSFKSGDTIGVTFKVTTTSGKLIPLSELDAGGVWMAGPVHNYQHVLPGDAKTPMFEDVVQSAKMNDDGSYTYTFSTPIPDNYGVPLNNTTKFTEGELTGALQAGTYTLAMAFTKSYWVKGQETLDANSTSYNFGLNTTTIETHEIVAEGNCNACHERFGMHGGQFRKTAICVTCHTAGAEDFGSTDAGDATNVTIDFEVMIHKLHNGAHLPSVNGLSTANDGSRVYGAGTPYQVNTKDGLKDFSGITFPSFPNFNIQMPKNSGYSALAQADRTKDNNTRTGVTSCFNCHGDPDGAGPLPAPMEGDKAYEPNDPRACQSCHDDLDYTKPYAKNGSTMAANADPTKCNVCHAVSGGLPGLAVKDAHVHPLLNPAVTPTNVLNITGMGGATGANGNFVLGDAPTITFTAKDPQNANLPITYFDSFSLAFTGPTQARQVVIPGALSASPFDITGRVVASSTTNKGMMSKVYPTGNAVSETLTVEFTSATAFNVSGTVSGPLGSGALPASTSSYPTSAAASSYISNIVLSQAAVPQNITVAFTGPTTYTVTGSVSGAMGSGVLPASLGNTQRFTSSDGSVAFNVIANSTTAFAAGNNIYMTVFKGNASNPGLFAIVAGKTAFAVGDRIHFDFIAPANSYTMNVPMDLQFEYLGEADGSVGQTLTAGNLPVYFGRQTLWERTALVGTGVGTAAATAPMARFVFMSSLEATLANNDYVVFEKGTANEEYSRVSGIDTTLKRLTLAAPLRYAHAAGAMVQEATMTYRQEGAANYYQLNSAAGSVTFNAATTVGNGFIMSYRTAGRFGWKRKFGDTLQSWYYVPLNNEVTGLDATQGDWRGKPLVDGTYTVAIWGYRAIEFQSGSIGAYEWQTYRDTTAPGMKDFLFGATASTIKPYNKIDNAANCNGCHDYISFHGGGRLTADTCMMCHATPGPSVNYRTLLHGAHADTFPVFPNGSAECAKCHGTTDVSTPTSRAHPTQPGTIPSQDWTVACTGCHTAPSALAHAQSMIPPSGVESCATCHGEGRDLDVKQVHRAK